MMHRWMGWEHGVGFGGWLFMLAFWALAVLGLVFLVRLALGGGRPGPAAPETPFEILRRRYAQGELTREEFERMRREVE
ncbi:MAG: SHOCT domain-containing protein [Thermodesulfobacteriota bacterium]